MRRLWTKDDERLLCSEVILAADTSELLNCEELATMLKRTPESIRHKITRFRRSGKLPKYDPMNQIEKQGSYYSERESNMIRHLSKTHSATEVAAITGRTVSAINNFFSHRGYLRRPPRWTADEEQLLIDRITFDNYGITNNYSELCYLLNHDKNAIYAKVKELRAKGKLPPAKRSGMSEQELAAYRPH